jgi:tripartite-type tricarboxylate transporter receptor subunit TctC
MKIASMRAAATLALTFAALMASGMTHAQQYPSRPIRFIVGTPPGGATDLTTRIVAQKMSEKLGQPIIVENKAGGDTVIATRYVKEQPADGYTILAQSLGFSTLPHIKLEPGYSLKDFTGVGMMTKAPFLMLVAADSPVRSVPEYVQLAKATPLSYGHGGLASAPNIAAENFLRANKLEVQGVPYKGNGPVIPDVLGGRLSMFFDLYISSASFVKSGKMRALAVAAPDRLAAAPEVPTFKELGLDYSYSVWLGLIAKAGTPPDVISKLSDALQFALNSKELTERFRNDGALTVSMTPKEFTDYLAHESAEMAKVTAEMKFVKE